AALCLGEPRQRQGLQPRPGRPLRGPGAGPREQRRGERLGREVGGGLWVPGAADQEAEQVVHVTREHTLERGGATDRRRSLLAVSVSAHAPPPRATSARVRDRTPPRGRARARPRYGGGRGPDRAMRGCRAEPQTVRSPRAPYPSR